MDPGQEPRTPPPPGPAPDHRLAHAPPPGRGYRWLRRLARLLLSIFYRSWSIEGREKIPRGPLVVCANHHGSLVDPLVLIAGLERPLRSLAKAPLFFHPVLRPLLRAAGALPVFRPQDRHLVQGSNADLLRACRDALVSGQSLLIFPEGLSKETPRLSAIRPGAARVALDAEAHAGFSLGLSLLPVGIHFHEAARFRRGRILARVGAPLAVADHRSTYDLDPERAVSELTERLRRSLEELIVSARSREDLELLHLAMRAWSRQRGERPPPDEEWELARSFAGGYQRALELGPGRLEPLRSLVESWSRTLEHFRLSGDEIDAIYRPSVVIAFTIREGLLLVLGSPLGIAGLILNWLPYKITSLVSARLSESEDVWASLKLATGLVVFPLWWIAVAAAALLARGPAVAAAALAALPLLGLWCLRFRDRQERVRRQIRGFLLLAGGGGLRAHLAETRRAIHDEVERLRHSLETSASDDAGAACEGG